MANTQEPFRVLIAGAGIGGLATAVALSRISGIPNLDIQLYEQADELLEIGASIALSPNVSAEQATQSCLSIIRDLQRYNRA
jgi:salicylate hydroxylase